MNDLRYLLVVWCLATLLIQAPIFAQTVQLQPTLRILALGDSYTIGESVSPNQRWPIQLGDSLKNRGFVVDTTAIIATTGWTTGNLLAAISAQQLATMDFNLVGLLIGVNNQYQNRPLAEYQVQFAQLLDSAIAYAGGQVDQVFVVSIPDWAYTPFGQASIPGPISQAIDQFNATNKSITEARGVAYIDITPISRNGISEPVLVAGDGLHPSGEQYRRWVQAMLPVLTGDLTSIDPELKMPWSVNVDQETGRFRLFGPEKGELPVRWEMLDMTGRLLETGVIQSDHSWKAERLPAHQMVLLKIFLRNGQCFWLRV
ncbi:SGNH/GDSL hydrolase family protein [Pontibacter sp. G13]|uniref:SGNH/GDSL hydrolase family protein n=1 Tax=Pontibacter sp. G13 TaxID=3074898 RepID=UPI00288A35AF|nr:SGNH/GDSL hydrolase family protein [Pontibacter sp. G13]WNJ18213.1 SGNH/GDSL hydrolase family protein [Pontibacter sp. G13]